VCASGGFDDRFVLIYCWKEFLIALMMWCLSGRLPEAKASEVVWVSYGGAEALYWVWALRSEPGLQRLVGGAPR